MNTLLSLPLALILNNGTPIYGEHIADRDGYVVIDMGERGSINIPDRYVYCLGSGCAELLK